MAESMKSKLRRKYENKIPFSKSDLKWMDKHDWHPVDEKPLKKSFLKSLAISLKQKSKPTAIEKLFK